MNLKSSVVIFEPLQPQWPQQPQQPLQPYFIKTFAHSDDRIIPGIKMTNTSPFLCKE
jgi:hypothetical protein